MAAVLVNPGGPRQAIVDLTAELASIAGKDHGETGRLGASSRQSSGAAGSPDVDEVRRSLERTLHPGPIMVQPLTGQIRVRWHGEETPLASGRLLAMASNVPHDVIAETDAVFLLTIARPQAD